MRRIERSALIFVVGTVLGVTLVGCARNDVDYGPAFASAETRGEIVYERNCSACHEAAAEAEGTLESKNAPERRANHR